MTINGSTNSSAWTFKLEAYEIGTYSIENNTSTVRVDMYLGRANTQSYIGTNWNGSITVDGSTQYLNGNIPYPTYINGGDWYYLGTKDFTVSHNTDGTKIAGISSSWSSESGVVPSSASASGNLTLTTIPRASSITATNADIGSATTIVINKASSSFTHTITYSFGSLSGTIATKTSNTTIGWTVPTTFYAQIPNSKSGTCTITCETYNGSTLIGTKTTTFTATANETLSKPTLTANVIDINQTTINLTGDNTKLVKYFSNVSITYTPTARNSASIVETRINNQIVSTHPYVIQKIETIPIKITTKDSRGYTTTITLNPTTVDYIPLTANVSFFRPQPTTGEVSLEFEGNYFNDSFGAENNTLTLSWFYQEAGAGSWTTGGTLVIDTDYKITNNTYHSGSSSYKTSILLGNNFDYKKKYYFRFDFEDKLKYKNITGIVSKGIPIINWDDDHFNVNGDITQNEGALISANIYNSNETVIGKWIDGKPLYRLIVDAGVLPNATSKNISLPTSNIDRVIRVYGYGYYPNWYQTIILNGAYIGIQIFHSTTPPRLIINTDNDLSNYTESYIILEYTKTSD